METILLTNFRTSYKGHYFYSFDYNLTKHVIHVIKSSQPFM